MARSGPIGDHPLRCGGQSFIRPSRQAGFVTARFACVLVVAGGGELLLDAQRFTLEPGCAYKRFPGRVHDVRYLQPTRTVFVAVHAGVFQTLRDLALPGLEEPVIRPGCDGNLIARFERQAQALHGGGDAALHLTGLVDLVVELHQRARHRADPWAVPVARARDLLVERPEFGVAAIARELDLATSTLRKHFKRLTGSSPVQWRIDARIRHACDLLADPSLRIDAVADACGYGDVFAFSTQFRQRTGCSPSTWRRRQLGDEHAPTGH